MTLGLLVVSENVDKQTDTQDSCFISIDIAISLFLSTSKYSSMASRTWWYIWKLKDRRGGRHIWKLKSIKTKDQIHISYSPGGDDRQLLRMLERETGVWFALGCHPKDAHEFTEHHKDGLIEFLHDTEKVVALGVCGLDYSKGSVSTITSPIMT